LQYKDDAKNGSIPRVYIYIYIYKSSQQHREKEAVHLSFRKQPTGSRPKSTRMSVTLRLRALSVALGMPKCEIRNAKLKSWPSQLAWQRRACSPASGRTCLSCPDRTPRCQQNHAQVMQSDVMPHLLCSGILPTLGTPALTRRNSQDCVNQIKFSPCSAGSEHGCP